MERVEDSSTKTTSTQLMQIVVFRLGSEEYALSIDQIKEVVITPHITRIPMAPPFMLGVANVRGNIIGIVDLNVRFGVSKTADVFLSSDTQPSSYTLVIASEEYKVGLIVLEVPNTVSVPVSAFEPLESAEHKQSQTGIMGILKIGGRLVFLIDVGKMTTVTDSVGAIRLEESVA